MAVLGTENLHSIPQNCKRCSATKNSPVCNRLAVTFRTSATANAHCTSANFDRKYLLLFCPRDDLYFLEVKFCRRPDVDLQKKVINTRTLTTNPENTSVHFQAVLPRNRQHCLLLCRFTVNFSFFTANICGSANLW